MRKKISYSLLAVLTLLIIFNWSTVLYGLRQGKGQLSMVWNTTPINELMEQKDLADSTRKKLGAVKDILKFCEDSLRLEVGDNYQEYYDQKGKPGMYVVTAALPYELKSYQWSFPFLGEFSYKGYFDLSLAQEEAKQIEQQGYDVDIDGVNAWSTLGWFTDPVMSSMIEKSEGKLARVLIHEITHYNIFVKNDMQLNENLASFIGDQGALVYLKHRYTEESPEVQALKNYLSDLEKFTLYMMDASAKLNEFYAKELPSDSTQKQLAKRKEINRIIEGLKEIGFSNNAIPQRIIKRKESINNTFFTDFLTYRAHSKSLLKELNKQYKGQLAPFIAAKRKQYQ